MSTPHLRQAPRPSTPQLLKLRASLRPPGRKLCFRPMCAAIRSYLRNPYLHQPSAFPMGAWDASRHSRAAEALFQSLSRSDHSWRSSSLVAVVVVLDRGPGIRSLTLERAMGWWMGRKLPTADPAAGDPENS
ncbi:hypothetical protein K402DRAFT_392934 [Aulographum hederae CBS 113979]|uniref:Uncharacterized protein n=1 Tax=Aulographum hederae CBS 113979 TaxID=1176131 RepID=A0A6G1H1Z0_9PEZI|nr:hypothetical protein K402DRAFT_392934 [Aulographum hederae CBS 113979]